MVISPSTGLLEEGGRKTVGEGLVVGELSVDEVVDLQRKSVTVPQNS